MSCHKALTADEVELLKRLAIPCRWEGWNFFEHCTLPQRLYAAFSASKSDGIPDAHLLHSIAHKVLDMIS